MMLSLVIEKENFIDEKNVAITDKNDIKHIVNVYRLNVLDEVRLVDNKYEYLSKIIKISKKEVLLSIISKKEDKYSLAVELDVAIGIIKNDNMKLLIKKLTEIGVRNIIPLKTDRVVVKIDNKKEKWDDIVKEAMKQCRAVKKTNIKDIVNLKNIKKSEYDKVIYMYENSEKSLKIIDAISSSDKKILCIIGPEGGFSDYEVNFMEKNNFTQINLGNRILRAETAAILVSSIISHIFGY